MTAKKKFKLQPEHASRLRIFTTTLDKQQIVCIVCDRTDFLR